MILNIEKSIQLYFLIAPFAEEAMEKEDILEFSSTIVDKILESSEPEKFLHIATLLTGKKIEELLTVDKKEFVLEFMTTLIENRVLDLLDFYKRLENG